MKNKLYVLLIVTAFSLGISAQTVSDKKSDGSLAKAELLYKNKDYASALKAYTSISIQYSDKGVYNNDYIKSVINAARCHEKLGSYKEGMEMAQILLTLTLDDNQKKETYEVLTNNGLLYGENLLKNKDADYPEIRKIFEQLLPYAEGNLLHKVKVGIQKTYIMESKQCVKLLKHEKAESLLKKAMTISDDKKIRMEASYYLASLNESKGDYNDMLENYKEAARLAEILKDDKFLYTSIVGERNVYKMQDNMEDFTRLGVKLDSLMSVSDNPQILSSFYDYIGNEFVDLGNYSIAESYFRRYENLINNEKDLSARFNYEILYLSNMRDLKRKQKDYKSAIEFNSQLADRYKMVFDNKNYMYYISYLVDTQLYAEIGDSLNFERTCDSLLNAIDIMPDAFNKSLVYNFRGAGYSKFNNSAKALSNYHKSDSILAEKYDETHDMRMLILKLRAGEYKKMGLFKEACRDYKHFMELTAKVYGSESQQYSDAVYTYANSERMNKNWEYSASLYRESIDIMNKILRKQLRYVTATDRISYINALSSRMWLMSSFALSYSSVDKDFVKDCYNTILVLKSLLFESDRSMYNTLQTKGTADDVTDFVTLSQLRNKQRSLYRDYEKNKKEIDANYLKMREIDHRLTEKSQAYNEYTSFLDFKYEDVCSLLGKKEVLFDFYDYVENGIHKYVAYIVKKGNKNPIIVDMFSEAQIDSILNGLDVDMLYTEKYSDKAINLLWKRLEKYADKDSKVYYVPSGIMYQLSLESLPLEDGSLLGEHYRFVRLSSAREIAESKKTFSGDKNAVLYGGLNYDVDIADMKRQSSLYADKKLYVTRSIAQGSNKFNYLPETLHETQIISEILKSNGYDVTFYSENEGTEESFLNMHNNSPQILHLATHGFYYTPAEAAESKLLKGSTDAMFLSGLVLSGGNAAWQGKALPSGVLGGIVSAGNISCLDLSNINLVVLSACQSGAGKITRQGLFGLQRAFKKAGAQTMVMTLWKVSDVVTSEFMVEFYKNLFSGRKGTSNKVRAFIKAKNKIREKYPEPLYWAGFVMVD